MKSNSILAASILISTMIASYVYINIHRYEVSNAGALYIDHWDHKVCMVTNKYDLQRKLNGQGSNSIFYYCTSIASVQTNNQTKMINYFDEQK